MLDLLSRTYKHPSVVTLVRSGVFIDGNELVVACGYTSNNQFGYFIVCEHRVGGDVNYVNQQAFLAKDSEKTYPEALRKLREIAANQK